MEDFLSRVPDWRPEIEADLRLAALAKEQLSKVNQGQNRLSALRGGS